LRPQDHKFSIDFNDDCKFYYNSENFLTFNESIYKIHEYLKSLSPDCKAFKDAIEKLSYPSLITKVVLRSQEEGIDAGKEYDKIDYEHVMPKRPSKTWENCNLPKDSDNYKKLVNNLGNLFVINKRKNKKAGNKSFEEKKKLYCTLSNWSINEYTKELKEWTPELIEKRAKEIAEYSAEYWSF